MMKKLFISGAALLLVAGLASCGGPTPSDPTSNDDPVEKKDVTLKVWGPAEYEDSYNIARDIVNADESVPYNITLEFGSVGENAATTEVEKDPDAAATVFFYADDQTLRLKAVNALSSVEGENKVYVQETCTEGAVAAATMNNEMVAYPASVDNLWFMNYDKSFFDETDILSLETMLEKADAAGMKLSMPFNEGWYILPSFFYGAELYWTKDAEGTINYTTDIDSEECVTRATYLNELLSTYYKKGTLVIGQDLGGESLSVATFNGAWNYSSYLETLGDNLGLAVTPSYKVGDTSYQMTSFLGAKLLGVNARHDADKVEAGHYLAKALLGLEASISRYTNNKQIPVNVEALSDPRYTENVTPDVAIKSEQAAIGGFSQAATIQSDPLWNIFGNALGKGLVGNGSENDPETGLINDWAAYLSTQATAIRSLH